MIFDSKAFLYSNTITHEGKLIVFGIEDGGDGQANIWYTVKQDGFEKSYLDANPSQISGWEEWKLLGFPNEDDDTSVTAKEEKDRKAQSDPNRFLIGSSYQSSSRTEIAPIQVVSGLGHLYVFRQSRDNTLLADRFVLDGMANKLTRKFEVRYRRSKKRFKSAGNEIGSETGLLQKIDSLDFKDIEGKPFYEPTTELSVICNLTAGEFSVVLLPTSQQDKYRWHIFAYNNETKLVEITSIQASDEGLFDIQDQAVQDPTMRSIPGIIRHKLDFKDAAFSRGLTATRYEVQRATQTDTGTQLIRDSIRVMAAFVTTAGNTVAVSFSVATDGTLSQIAETPSETEQLRFTPKAVLLPFNDLDDIVARVDEPLPKGAIQAIRQGDDEKELLTIGTADAPGVKPADSVKLSSIADFNKVFQTVMTIDENTFEVSPPSAAIGNWELVPEDPKTLYEGMITGYRTVDGRLRITAVNHGLETGDRVRITGTRDYSGVYSVKSVGNREITFESTSWETGSAINVGKIRDNRRHSLVFDGVDDYVQLPAMTFDFAKGVTLEAWVRYYSLRNWSRILDFGNGQGNLNIVLANTDVSGELRFFIDNEESVAYVSVSAPDALPLDSWIHVAATVEPSGKATLYTDGVELASGMLEGTPEPVSRTQNYIGKSNWEGDEFFEGQIADVRIWSRALSGDEIRNNMYRPLTGQEKDLRGFWRLNGIADAQTPDFSGFGNDGVVFGGAYISGSRIGRDVSVPFGSGATPKSQPATRFDNDNLIAVTSGAVYTEEFEFRVWGTKGDPVEPPANPFEIIWRGKQTRASLEWSEIKSLDSTVIENIGGNWYKASARFRVPDGIRFVRQFGIAKVTGKWSEIEIRKHAIVMISDTVTMVTYSDSANLETLTDPSNENRDTCRLIARYELRQARLEIQRRSLAAAAADSSPAALQRKIDEKTKFLEVLQLEIDSWSERLGWARQNLEDIKKKVTVFWRENYTAESLVLDVGSYRDLGAYYNEVRGRDWGKEICSVKVPDGLCLTLYENMDFDGESLPLTSDTPRLRPYRLSRRDTSWHDEALSLAVHVRNGSSDAEEVERDINLRQVALEVRERAKQDAREAIEQLKVALDDPGNPSRRLEQVNDDLGKIQIPALSEFPGTQAQSMPTIKRFKGLGTQAAVLDFVKPTGRLHALETCEGNVQLAYFDENGRMRQTNFDATVDSANAFSEQWIVDPIVRSCLDFSGGQSLTLDESVELGDEWTAEAWFFYPLPDNGGQWRLFSAKSKDDPVIVVKSGDEERLGLKVDGRFFDSAFDMKELSIGWHHLAAVANEDGTTFYIDGQNVGTAVAKSSEDIYGICSNLDGPGQSFGKVAEVRIWENALSSEEILANSVTTLTGNEAGLVAYLPMTDGLGQSVTDKSGNRHDGTVVGIPAWVACTAPIGHFGHQVVRFDMASDSINLPHFGAGAFNQNQITYEAWVRYDDQHSRIRVVTFENSTTSDSIALIVDGNTDNLTIEVANAESQKQISADNALKCGEWQHLAVTLDPSGNAELFVNGIMVKSGIVHAPPDVDFDSNFIGKGFAESGETYSVLIAEIRIWNIIRTVDEIRNGMSRRLSDDVDGLVSYWPLDQHSLKKSSASGDPITVKDKVETWDDGTLAGESFLMISNTLPISGNTLACAEYATIGEDLRTQKKTSVMRRGFLSTSPGRIDLISGKRVESLELVWIGNGQFEPTLLGYIEGPPPVPSENLTIEENYNGAASVELSLSEDMEYTWQRSDDLGFGVKLDAFLGVDTEVEAVTTALGVGSAEKLLEIRGGYAGNLETGYQFQNESTITAGSGRKMADRLELCGTRETEAKFPQLGKRFIPKNVGYALVVSSPADVFVSRLARTKKMISYLVLPIEGIPIDVNTVTFMINPAYTMSGSLDGMTGSVATSQRFFRHVPEMRAQVGSLYPASYFRLQEAYDLKSQIEKQDKQRESYFAQFNSGLLDAPSLNREIEKGPAPVTAELDRDGDKKVEAADGATVAASAQPLNETQDKAKADLGSQKTKAVEKQNEIKDKIKDIQVQAHASAAFSSWQRKMENIQIRAGKRNIVNNYVWDADGGLRSEAQTFASTAEHTIGGSFSMNAALGHQSSLNVISAAVDLSLQGTVSLALTMSKTQKISRGVELNIDMSEIESRGVTNYNDSPIQPGEKVDRFRFMSYYLEGSTKNFDDFFEYVVDPEWLASNDEEARALRQAQKFANKAWRVLHRVTYVERPALADFGRDVRSVMASQGGALETDLSSLRDKIRQLQKENTEIKDLLNQILQKVSRQ